MRHSLQNLRSVFGAVGCVECYSFVDLLNELAEKETLTFADQAQMSLVAEKETHTESKAKVGVIWGDYFKAPQFEKFPDTNELVHKIAGRFRV